MLSIRQRSVNVSRVELLAKLKENLELHRAEYKEALVEFHARLLEDLKLAHKKVSKTEKIEDLAAFAFHVSFPPNHENDYIDVIEMLELSVDEHINLDGEAFRAYIKNEWNWQHHFRSAKASYATVGSSLSL